MTRRGPDIPHRGMRVRALCHYRVHILFFGLALTWVGDFDDMQRLIKIGGGLLPFSGVEGEDRIDCHIHAIAPAWASHGSRPFSR
jgi:hypothetical protein